MPCHTPHVLWRIGPPMFPRHQERKAPFIQVAYCVKRLLAHERRGLSGLKEVAWSYFAIPPVPHVSFVVPPGSFSSYEAHKCRQTRWDQ